MSVNAHNCPAVSRSHQSLVEVEVSCLSSGTVLARTGKASAKVVLGGGGGGDGVRCVYQGVLGGDISGGGDSDPLKKMDPLASLLFGSADCNWV